MSKDTLYVPENLTRQFSGMRIEKYIINLAFKRPSILTSQLHPKHGLGLS